MNRKDVPEAWLPFTAKGLVEVPTPESLAEHRVEMAQFQEEQAVHATLTGSSLPGVKLGAMLKDRHASGKRRWGIVDVDPEVIDLVAAQALRNLRAPVTLQPCGCPGSGHDILTCREFYRHEPLAEVGLEHHREEMF